MPRVAVVGAGAWGTALAVTAARAGAEVVLWGRDAGRIEGLRQRRENPPYLPGIILPEAVRPESRLETVADAEMVLLAVPAQRLRELCRNLSRVMGAVPLVVCAKGLEQTSGLRLSEVVAAELPAAPVAALSGPSFALEVGQGLPTAVTIAAEDRDLAVDLAQLLASTAFRPYASDDLLGVELAGALKNVIAIAAGVAMGKGLGENARASLITRGLAEMARLTTALGARRETLMGLAGLGDLLLTATSLTSRNTSFGLALAQGRSPAELMAAGGRLSEGAYTADAACTLAARVGVELPVAEAVRAVIAGELDLDAAISGLLARPLPTTE